MECKCVVCVASGPIRPRSPCELRSELAAGAPWPDSEPMATDEIKTGESAPGDNEPGENKSDEQWREQLTPDQYRIARQGGTERAFTGKFYEHKAEGIYQCVCCGAELFHSDTKYASGSGWPSFYRPANEDAIKYIEDRSHGMVRTEVRCGQCDAHLGHMFDDGPDPTGNRYCINSVSLSFDGEDG